MKSILHQIEEKLLTSRKNRDIDSSVLATLLNEVKMKGKNDGNRETTDDEAVAVIKKFVKDLNCVLDNTTDDDKIQETQKEIVAVVQFLPKQLTEEELRNIIKDIISHDSEINLGKVMGFLKKQYNGLYDGKRASSITKELL